MIDVSQWRAAIGTFNKRKTSHIPKQENIFNILHQCLDNDEFKSNLSYVMVCVYLLIVAILVNIYSSVEAIL